MAIKLLYLAFARMPTEKAHGLTIAKSCEGFARAGAEVTLVVPKRATPITDDIYTVYGVEHNFHFEQISVPDIFAHFPESKLAHRIHHGLFLAAVALRLLFGSRQTIIYAREPQACVLSQLGYRVVYECHHIFDRSPRFFALARRAHRIVTISHALKRTFLDAGFDERRILVAPSGVDLAVFGVELPRNDARRQLDLPLAAKIAVYTGNFTTMDQDKGIHDIILALKDVPTVTFVAVGGRADDIERYEREARGAGVLDRVVLRGFAPQKELAVYQKAADMLLMPFPDTPHYRNHMSPVKMFEYMASGVPIIATDLPTITEVLNRENAIIIPPGDAKALAAAMTDLMSDNHRASVLAQRAREEVAAFTWNRRSQNIVQSLTL